MFFRDFPLKLGLFDIDFGTSFSRICRLNFGQGHTSYTCWDISWCLYSDPDPAQVTLPVPERSKGDLKHWESQHGSRRQFCRENRKWNPIRSQHGLIWIFSQHSDMYRGWRGCVKYKNTRNIFLNLPSFLSFYWSYVYLQILGLILDYWSPQPLFPIEASNTIHWIILTSYWYWVFQLIYPQGAD